MLIQKNPGDGGGKLARQFGSLLEYFKTGVEVRWIVVIRRTAALMSHLAVHGKTAHPDAIFGRHLITRTPVSADPISQVSREQTDFQNVVIGIGDLEVPTHVISAHPRIIKWCA